MRIVGHFLVTSTSASCLFRDITPRGSWTLIPFVDFLSFFSPDTFPVYFTFHMGICYWYPFSYLFSNSALASSYCISEQYWLQSKHISRSVNVQWLYPLVVSLDPNTQRKNRNINRRNSIWSRWQLKGVEDCPFQITFGTRD